MPMNFNVSHPGGAGGSLTATDVLDQVKNLGYNPQSVSPDGMTMTLMDDQGEYQMPIPKLLSSMGWKVNAALPENADYSGVQPEWRAAIGGLADDDMKRAYIEGKMKRAGVEQPQVTGGGRDWYVFNPGTNQWIGATNNPDWDKSDLVEGAMTGARAVGAALGGAGGAALGGGTPASIAGAMGGSALGGGAVDSLMRGGLASFDPEYRQVAGQNVGAIAGDVGFNAAIDGATGGLGVGLPAGIKAAFGQGAGQAAKTAMYAGPASTLARGTGRTVRAAGQLTGVAGRGLDTSLGKLGAEVATPIVADVAGAGALLQAPGWLPRGAAKAAGWAGNKVSQAAQEAAPNLNSSAARKAAVAAYREARNEGISQSGARQFAKYASEESNRGAVEAAKGAGGGLRRFANDMLRPRVVQSEELASAMVPNRGLAGPRQASATDIYGNMFERGRSALDKSFGPTSRRAEQELLDKTYQDAMQYGVGEVKAKAIARAAVRDTIIPQRMARASAAGQTGEKVGRVMQSAEELGQGVGAVASGAVNLGIKGVRGAGAAMRGGGRALEEAGKLGQPLEFPAMIREGLQQNTRPYWEEKNPWRKKAYGGSLTLAQSPT